MGSSRVVRGVHLLQINVEPKLQYIHIYCTHHSRTKQQYTNDIKQFGHLKTSPVFEKKEGSSFRCVYPLLFTPTHLLAGFHLLEPAENAFQSPWKFTSFDICGRLFAGDATPLLFHIVPKPRVGGGRCSRRQQGLDIEPTGQQ